jgi:large subunit ribosomal protein L10
MKTRARKQEDLNILTEQFKNSKAAIVLSFNKLTVEKDQQFRNELRETGATYRVVKNTLARLAVEGTEFEGAKEHFKGVTSVAWTSNDPVDLSKVISKYIKDQKEIFEFKTGVVDGRVITVSDVEAIASLPSKEELIGKLLYLLNAPAQRLATVLNAVPRNLAVVLQQVAEGKGSLEAPAAEAPAEEAKAEEAAPAEAEAPAGEVTAEEAPAEEASAEEAPAVEAAAPEAEAAAEEGGSDEAAEGETEEKPAE